MEQDDLETYKDLMEEVEDLKKSKVGINTTTEALLMIILDRIDESIYLRDSGKTWSS